MTNDHFFKLTIILILNPTAEAMTFNHDISFTINRLYKNIYKPLEIQK